MKIGVGAYNYFKYGEARYEKLKAHGFTCVDFRMMDIHQFPYVSSLRETQAKLLREKELAQNAGVEIYQVHGPWVWPPEPYDATQESRKKKLEDIKRSIWATAVLGCKHWVIHPLMPCGRNDKITKEQDITLNINLEFMSKVLEIGKEYDVTICLENMPMRNFSIATPDEILKFVNIINDDHFKICFDTGHAAAFAEVSVADAVRDLGSNIRAFHVHDNRPGNDLHLWPYFGRIDWKDFSKALREIHYEGGICLETAPPMNLPEDLYDNLCVDLFRIAQTIIKDEEKRKL